MKPRSKQSSAKQETLLQDIQQLEEQREKVKAELDGVKETQPLPRIPFTRPYGRVEFINALPEDQARLLDVVKVCKSLDAKSSIVPAEAELGALDREEAAFLAKDHRMDENVVAWLHGDPRPHPEIDIELPTVEMTRPLKMLHAVPSADLNAAEVGKSTDAASSASYNFQSPWKRALWQALIDLGIDARYQDCANWIAERLPTVKLPKYFGDRADVGLVVRQNEHARDQFQKDLTKVRNKLRNKPAV